MADPIRTSTCMATLAMACSTASWSASGSLSTPTSTPSTNCPRITTCSTSSSATPCLVSAAKRTDETPGLSGPVVVIRTGICVMAILHLRAVACSTRLQARPAGPACPSLFARVVLVVRARHGRVGEQLRRRLRPVTVLLRLAGEGDLAFAMDPLDHMRVVQLERRTLGPDPRQLGEVVPRRRAGRRPLQRVPVAPRVVDRHDLAVPVALEDVPDERQRRSARDVPADRGDRVRRGETVGGQVVRVPAGQAPPAQ